MRCQGRLAPRRPEPFRPDGSALTRPFPLPRLARVAGTDRDIRGVDRLIILLYDPLVRLRAYLRTGRAA